MVAIPAKTTPRMEVTQVEVLIKGRTMSELMGMVAATIAIVTRTNPTMALVARMDHTGVIRGQVVTAADPMEMMK